MGYVDVEQLYGPEINDEHIAQVYEYDNTPENRSWAGALPRKQGLYDPELEKDACGVGFAAYVHGEYAVTVAV
jgi:glutamate synthase (NADH)